ncbi:oocyte zinc finger protein XlCOF6-like isoform X2 [Manduca sexta]|uniref:oocyte zinc finger protein XlCOF6-like isoform X2 n=1 Tax=Manduca sexta TaxID=7130 RepID=UPI0018909A87|nr:oocyte zinc finger protein XlCOF6-like isoform X2 [Manduca sexta]
MFKCKIRACRTCLNSENEYNALLNGENWLELLEYCFGIHVKVQEEPQTICRKCSDVIRSFAKFKKKCLATDALWKSVTSEDNYLKRLIQNYTTEVEMIMKNKLLDIQNINDIFHEKKSEIGAHDIKIKDEGNKNIEIETIKFLDEDYEYRSDDTLDNDSVNFHDRLQITYDNDHKDKDTIKKRLIDDCKYESDDALDNNFSKYNDKLQAINENDLEHKDNIEKDLLDSGHKCGSDDGLDNDSGNVNNRLETTDDNSLGHNDNFKINNDTIKGILKCQKCNKVYGREGWLKMHMTLCGKTKDEKKEIRRNNKKTQEHLCGLCRFTSKSEQLVSRHFEEHCSRNDLRCQMCEFVGRDFADMVAHRISHNSEALKVKKSCPACKKTFVSRLSMQFHYRSAHLNKNGGYCSKCDIEFSLYKTFESHVRTHAGRKYVCDVCGLRFFKRSRIIEHLRNHKEINNFICDECGKGFKRHNNLLFHMRTVHVKEQPLNCTHCNKMFKNLYTLKMHRKRQLGTKNSLKCEFCGKCFASPHLLRSHRFWHSEERPHCCEICGSRYKAKGQLKVHMQKHTGSKPFECDLCSKCFTTARELRRHASVHTGIRPHKCPHCDRTFHSKKQMLKHSAFCHKGCEVGKVDKSANK